MLEAPKLTPFHRWLTRYALARADAITATGLHLATETTRYAPRGDAGNRRALRRRPAGASRPVASGAVRTDVVIGTAARLSPEKGVRYLIEAFAQLRATLRRARQPAHRRRRARSARRLEALVQTAATWTRASSCAAGWSTELPAFLRGLDVFVLPST